MRLSPTDKCGGCGQIPFDPCAQCNHYRFQHDGGLCQEKRVDPTGKPVPCGCPGFVEPKKKS
jgi:hypothetical protein